MANIDLYQYWFQEVTAGSLQVPTLGFPGPVEEQVREQQRGDSREHIDSRMIAVKGSFTDQYTLQHQYKLYLILTQPCLIHSLPVMVCFIHLEL